MTREKPYKTHILCPSSIIAIYRKCKTALTEDGLSGLMLLIRRGFAWRLSSIINKIELRYIRMVESICLKNIRVDKLGIKEALAFSWRLDIWQRNALVAEEIKRDLSNTKDHQILILDVGSGRSGINDFLNYPTCTIFCIDIDFSSIIHNSSIRIVGNGAALPVRSNSVDYVVSVDSLEHVPKELRNDYLEELDRVSRRKVLLHCPVDNSDGKYAGSKYDKRFQDAYLRMFGHEEPNTKEHFKNGLPKCRTINQNISQLACSRNSKWRGMVKIYDKWKKKIYKVVHRNLVSFSMAEERFSISLSCVLYSHQ